MPSLTYGLQSAKDMLAKLRRERERLRTEVTSDNFFNFVVTAYHLVDWVKKDPAVHSTAKNTLPSTRAAPCIATCRDLANASKHFRLRSKYLGQVTSAGTSKRGFGVGRFGKGGYGVGEEAITIVLADGTTLNALQLAEDTVNEWESFFARHGL